MIIKEGMIGFSGGNIWIQKAIRFFIDSKFSHSFVIVNGPLGYMSAFETTETLVCLTPFDRKEDENNWVELWDVVADSNVKYAALKSSYWRFSGKWYGYLSYSWFMYRYVARKFKHEPTKMWEWCNSGVTCTELTCQYVSTLFPNLFKNDLNTYSPSELRKIMVDNPDKFTNLGWYKK